MNGAPGYHALSPERMPMSPPPDTSDRPATIADMDRVGLLLCLASAVIALLAIYGAADLVLRFT